MNRPVGAFTPPKVSTVRKSRFSFSNKQAQNLGDSMLDHYAELAQKISKTKDDGICGNGTQDWKLTAKGLGCDNSLAALREAFITQLKVELAEKIPFRYLLILQKTGSILVYQSRGQMVGLWDAFVNMNGDVTVPNKAEFTAEFVELIKFLQANAKDLITFNIIKEA